MAQLQNSGVPTRSRGEARADFPEQQAQRLPILDPALDQPARVQVSPAGQGDQLFRERAQLLGLGFGGNHPAMGEQTGCHVVQHRPFVARGARELAALSAMTHYRPSPAPIEGWTTGATPGRTIRSSPSVSSKPIPKFSPSRCSSSAISLKAFSPTFFTLSRSSSLNSTRSLSVRMFEFFKELRDLTLKPKSSIGRAKRWRRLLAPPTPSLAPASRIVGTLPKSTK